MATRYEAAMYYVNELNLSVIPITKGKKSPAIPWKEYQRRKPHQTELVDWFHQADYQIGIVCGTVSGGLTVIDFETVPAYDEWAGRHPRLAATTRTVETGNGIHVYVRLPNVEGNHKLVPGLVETRGEGGMVLAPPSLHPVGRHYSLKGDVREIVNTTWEDVSQGENWEKRQGKVSIPQAAETIAFGAETGTRNDSVFNAAVVLRDTGAPRAQAVTVLLKANEKNDLPLSADEVRRTIESAYSRPARNRSEEASASTFAEIMEEIGTLRELRNAYWAQNKEPPDSYEQVKEIFRKSGYLDSAAIEQVLTEVERKPSPLAEKCRAELRKIWTAARKFAQAGGVFVVSSERPTTWPYDVKDGRLVYLTERIFFDTMTIQRRPVADFHAKITSQITNEDGSRTFFVNGTALRGGSFAFEMDAEEFGNDRKLKAVIDAASGARSPVRAGMGKHLAPALQLLTGDEMTQLKRYRRTGWEGRHFLIPGREPDGVLIELPRKPPFRIDKEASLSLGLEALDALLTSMTPERTTVAASLMFQAPLSKLAKWDNERYAIFISGRTGSFKTSFAQVLMCIYGARFIDDELLVKWGEGATSNAMMSIATSANDMPFLIDNFKPSTGGGARAFIALVHNILEGGEKDRLNRASQLRETKPVFCWPICTGEDVPDSDPSSLARILVVPFFWQEKRDNPELSRAQELSGHLSAIGDAWLSWLETQESREIIVEIAAKFPQYRADWVDILSALRGDSVNRRRVASNLATNQLTWEILCQHPTIGSLAKKYRDQHLIGLRDIVALAMAEATAEALEASRYLAAIKELLMIEQASILDLNAVGTSGPKERIIGYQDHAGIYLLPKTARRAVEHLLNDDLNGISQTVLHRQLDGRGKIASHNKGTLLKSKGIDGKVIRVLHLKADALDELDGLSESNLPQPVDLEIIPF